jgi:lysozyme
MNGQAFTQSNEGCELTAYQDTLGIWTVGYGHTDPGVCEGLTITQDQADTWFEENYQTAVAGAAAAVPGAWESLGPVRQAALTDMAYQLGATGLAHFPKMLSAVRENDWQTSHDEVLNSVYATQVPRRANAVAGMLLTGEWPE